MNLRNSFFSVLSFAIILSACNSTQSSNSLQRSIPEAEGVSSNGILTFLDSASKSRHEFHSIMVLRHGKVVAEGWWNPYSAELKHTLYSTSKSFTSTAIGFAVSEKKLSLEDKVISFFPADKPDTISPFLADLKIKDLITMSVGQSPDPTFSVVSKDTNWVKSFLRVPILNKPGTKFLYNTLATYMLSAIVQKVTGEKVLDFLTPRLFKPLAIEGADWEVDPKGINTGGFGLRLKTEDMAKFGQLYLQKGMWNGKQIIPKEWVEEATSFKIDQAPETPQSKKDSSDWMQGYCYQFWRCRHNAFRADGAYGQFIIVMPEKDAVIAITAESPDMQDEINLVWKYLYPAIQDEKLAADESTARLLKERLSKLALPLPEKGVKSNIQQDIAGKKYIMNPNDMHVQSLQIQFSESLCSVNFKTIDTTYQLEFTSDSWKLAETNLPGPSLTNHTNKPIAGLPPLRIAGYFSWIDDNTLQLVSRYIESPHTRTYICHFTGDKITIDLKSSNSPAIKLAALEGKQIH